MGLKIRLRQQGRTNRLTYRLVVADVRLPRDGKYLEMVGHYDPHARDKNVTITEERLQYWIERGAEPTEKVLALIARSAPGVLKTLRNRKEKKKKGKKA